MEKRKPYRLSTYQKREIRRQNLRTILWILLVLLLAIIFGVTYFHARGGFVR